MGNVIVI